MAQLFIGVDGGGTKCRMRLADAQLKTLAEVVTEKPSNLQVRDGDAAYEAIVDCMPRVFAEAGLNVSRSRCRLRLLRHGRRPAGVRARRLRRAPLALCRRQGLRRYRHRPRRRPWRRDGAVIIIGTGSAAMAVVDGKRYRSAAGASLSATRCRAPFSAANWSRCSLEAEDGLVPSLASDRGGDVKIRRRSQQAVMALVVSGAGHRPPSPSGRLRRIRPAVLRHLDKGDPVALKLMELELRLHRQLRELVQSARAPDQSPSSAASDSG